MSFFAKTCAPMRAPALSAVTAASIFVRPAPSRRTATTSPSMRRSAPAAANALPPADALMRRLRTLLTAYREAGGRNAVVLFHDGAHGAELIDALARFGDGLPANTLPVQVNEITQIGLEAVAAAFAYGAGAARFLLRAKPRHDIAGLHKTIALAAPILAGLGFDGPRVASIDTDDPDVLGQALRALPPMTPAPRATTFAAVGGKREVVRLALRELHAVAPRPV